MSLANDLAVGMGYITVRELNAIQHIALRLPPDSTAVNIGSGAGTSVIAVLEVRADVKVVDVDIDPDNGMAQLRESGYLNTGRYERIVSDSKLCDWPHTTPYLFVDGDHTEAGIRGDLLTWLSRVEAAGYILLHDYWPFPDDHPLAGVDYWPAVRAVADEMMSDYTVIMDADRLRIYQA